MAEMKFKETEHKRLGEIAEVRRGVRVVRSQLGNGEYPVYQNSLVPLGYYDKFNCLAGTPFVIAAGAAGEIGYSKTNFWAADDCYYFICSEGLSNAYLYYYLLSQQSFIGGQVRKASIPRLNHGIISNLLVPLLPMGEQERIASALSAVDELLASLDKQIAKTRDIKQGVMQQLLASPSKWRPLKEVCHALPNEAIRVTQLTEFGKYPVINSARKAIGYCDTYNNEGKSLVLTSHGEYAGYVHWLESPFFAGALCYPMRSKNENELLSKFIYYWLQNEEERIREKFVNRSGVPYVDAKAFFASSIHIPPLEEQKRIVGTLTSLDDTITGLDAKRQKYESVKAGMMQLLLSCATCSVNS